jgi:hypothetical protein
MDYVKLARELRSNFAYALSNLSHQEAIAEVQHLFLDMMDYKEQSDAEGFYAALYDLSKQSA